MLLVVDKSTWWVETYHHHLEKVLRVVKIVLKKNIPKF